MASIVVATHGYFGQELIKSAEMIIGKIEDIYSISLTPDMSIDDFIVQSDEVLSKIDGRALCMVDLFAGTPCTGLTALSPKYDNVVVTGLNLAMLIEVCTNKDNDVETLAKLSLDTLYQSGRNVTEELSSK